MANENFIFRILVIAAIFGPFGLLVLGGVYGVLSARAMMFGVVAWWFAVFSVAVWRKLMVSTSATGSQIGVDDRTRRRILRGIRMNKIWIGLLLVCLPIGIVKGIEARAWLPTLVGVAVNQFLVYASAQEIKRRRKQLGPITVG